MQEPRFAIVSAFRPGQHAASARAITASRVRLTRRMPVAQSFRVTVLECLTQVGGNAPAIRARNPKGVHQIRVGLRRLEVAFKSFGEYADLPAVKALGKRGRTLANAFGPARDLDVFVDELVPQLDAELSAHESFVDLQLALRRARSEAWDAALAAVLDPEFALFLDDVAAVADTLADKDNRLGEICGDTLDSLQAKVNRRGRHARRICNARRHKLRVALKKLRYAAEFFAPLYPQREAASYIAKLKTLIDELGQANDSHGVGDLMGKLGDNPELCFAKGVVTGWYAMREKHLARRAMRGWREFKRLKPFWA